MSPRWGGRSLVTSITITALAAISHLRKIHLTEGQWNRRNWEGSSQSHKLAGSTIDTSVEPRESPRVADLAASIIWAGRGQIHLRGQVGGFLNSRRWLAHGFSPPVRLEAAGQFRSF